MKRAYYFEDDEAKTIAAILRQFAQAQDDNSIKSLALAGKMKHEAKSDPGYYDEMIDSLIEQSDDFEVDRDNVQRLADILHKE